MLCCFKHFPLNIKALTLSLCSSNFSALLFCDWNNYLFFPTLLESSFLPHFFTKLSYRSSQFFLLPLPQPHFILYVVFSHRLSFFQLFNCPLNLPKCYLLLFFLFSSLCSFFLFIFFPLLTLCISISLPQTFSEISIPLLHSYFLMHLLLPSSILVITFHICLTFSFCRFFHKRLFNQEFFDYLSCFFVCGQDKRVQQYYCQYIYYIYYI